VVVVQSGSWNGIPWALTAYRPQAQGICVGLTPNPPSGRPAAGPSGIGGSSVSTAGLVCSAGLHGMGAPPTGAPSHWLSFIGSDGAGEPVSGFPGFAAGAAAEGVATVEVILASGSSLLAETVPAPTELGQSVRFYVIRVPDGDSVTSLVAQDAQGETVEELTVPQASHAATAGP
jgi:hypothetical protein